MCCYHDGRGCVSIGDSPLEQKNCTDGSGDVVTGGGPGTITCGGTRMAYAANEIDPTAFYGYFQAIAFSQPRLLMDMYLRKFETGEKLVDINYHVFREKALPFIVDDKELLEEGMSLIVLTCQFANEIIINKLSGKTTPETPETPEKPRGTDFIFSQIIYDRFASFAEKILNRTSDPELKESFEFVLASLQEIVGKNIPQLTEFLDNAIR
jgi:hypothetical protein